MKQESTDLLFYAIRRCNLQQVKTAIINGADVNYIQRRQNKFYAGDQHTPLSAAFEIIEQDQENIIKIVQVLIDSGAKLDVYLERGSWKRLFRVSLLSLLDQVLGKLNFLKNKVKLLEITKKNIDINKIYNQGKGRNYRYFQPLLILAMRNFGLQVNRFKILETFNFQQRNKERSDYLKSLFRLQSSQSTIQSNNEYQSQEKNEGQQVKVQEHYLEGIKKILELGASVNQCYTSVTTPHHYSDLSESEDQQFTQNLKISPLHIAIANNLPELVQLLISHKADISQTCKYTIRVPVFPNEWQCRIKEKKVKKSLHKLRRSEKQKQDNEERLKGQDSQQQKRRYKKIIKISKFSILCLKTYNYENELPLIRYTNFEVSPFQLAIRFKVSERIIKMLEEKVE